MIVETAMKGPTMMKLLKADPLARKHRAVSWLSLARMATIPEERRFILGLAEGYRLEHQLERCRRKLAVLAKHAIAARQRKAARGKK
jgi:hypothetical protein